MPAPMYINPAEKNQTGFKVITPKIENKNVATKKDVKSLKRAFCASEVNSLKTNPKSAAAITGVNNPIKYQA